MRYLGDGQAAPGWCVPRSRVAHAGGRHGPSRGLRRTHMTDRSTGSLRPGPVGRAVSLRPTHITNRSTGFEGSGRTFFRQRVQGFRPTGARADADPHTGAGTRQSGGSWRRLLPPRASPVGIPTPGAKIRRGPVGIGRSAHRARRIRQGRADARVAAAPGRDRHRVAGMDVGLSPEAMPERPLRDRQCRLTSSRRSSSSGGPTPRCERLIETRRRKEVSAWSWKSRPDRRPFPGPTTQPAVRGGARAEPGRHGQRVHEGDPSDPAVRRHARTDRARWPACLSFGCAVPAGNSWRPASSSWSRVVID